MKNQKRSIRKCNGKEDPPHTIATKVIKYLGNKYNKKYARA